MVSPYTYFDIRPIHNIGPALMEFSSHLFEGRICELVWTHVLSTSSDKKQSGSFLENPKHFSNDYWLYTLHKKSLALVAHNFLCKKLKISTTKYEEKRMDKSVKIYHHNETEVCIDFKDKGKSEVFSPSLKQNEMKQFAALKPGIEENTLEKNDEASMINDEENAIKTCHSQGGNHDLGVKFQPSGATTENKDASTLELPSDEIKNKKASSRPSSPSQWKKMYSTQDWWSLWIGLASFMIGVALVFAVPLGSEKRIRYLVPQPMKWETNPLDSWDLYGIIGTFVMFVIFLLLYVLSLYFMGKFHNRENPPLARAMQYSRGFVGLCIVALISFWIGRQEWCLQHGLGYAVWSILIGMIIGNLPFLSLTKGLILAAKDGEYFIKCSLVLLAVEFRVLGEVGLPAIVVAWIGSPLSLITGYCIGVYLLKMNHNISLLISTGATWCGASAMSAIGSIIGSKPEDLSLCISLVAAATVIFTFLQPYIAMAVGMDDMVAGAWIGGSIDQTGNVVASASIISDEATEVAGVVKIVLNSGLGVLATIISLLWQIGSENNTIQNKSTVPKRKFSWLFLWDKFPKFVLGYLICSALLSIILPHLEDQLEGEALPRAVSTLNRWWFAIAFVGIGISTNLKELYHGARNSGVIQLYFITNTVDILTSLGLAYLVF